MNCWPISDVQTRQLWKPSKQTWHISKSRFWLYPSSNRDLALPHGTHHSWMYWKRFFWFFRSLNWSDISPRWTLFTSRHRLLKPAGRFQGLSSINQELAIKVKIFLLWATTPPPAKCAQKIAWCFWNSYHRSHFHLLQGPCGISNAQK